MTLNFCLHSTYNIKSKDLVNEPALLRATADGRCEKQLINRGGNQYVLNPLGTKGDQHQISPSNIPAVENKVVMRIRDIITQIL